MCALETQLSCSSHLAVAVAVAVAAATSTFVAICWYMDEVVNG